MIDAETANVVFSQFVPGNSIIRCRIQSEPAAEAHSSSQDFWPTWG